MFDKCEWNPDKHEPALHDTGCHNEAVWSVGADPKRNWHLCDSCAKLPHFKRLRKRTWIGPKED